MDGDELNTAKLQNRDLKMDSAIAIRCAKAALLLSDLQFSSVDEDQTAEKEISSELRRELAKLERQLLKERENNKEKKMIFHSLMELNIWIGIFFCLWKICLFLFFDSPDLY